MQLSPWVVVLAITTIIPGVHTSRQPADSCPVGNCIGLQARPVNTTSDEDAGGPWNVLYKPGHFICKKCDISACAGCAMLCDLNSCVGEFYKQQCWCEDGPKTHKVLCDNDCTGGVCDTPRFQCRSRESACHPWWWCGMAPPKTGPTDATLVTANTAGSFQGFLQRRARRQQLRSMARSSEAAAAVADLGSLNLKMGRYDCFSAAMPPKVWDDQTVMWVDRGYIILDRRTCQGDLFDKRCFCWDRFKYLSGQDPLTSELLCDRRCGMGPCAGRTCGFEPPPPLPPVPLAKGAKGTSIREPRLLMEPVDEPVVRSKN